VIYTAIKRGSYNYKCVCSVPFHTTLHLLLCECIVLYMRPYLLVHIGGAAVGPECKQQGSRSTYADVC
jgi:hypothetical protein